MKYIVDMNLEVAETTALGVEKSNSTNSNLLDSKGTRLYAFEYDIRCAFCNAPKPLSSKALGFLTAGAKTAPPVSLVIVSLISEYLSKLPCHCILQKPAYA